MEKKLLSYMIDRENISANALIRNSHIDRSTFYKIKKGEREPTEAQFCSIVRQLSLTAEEKQDLIEEYEYYRYWGIDNKQEFEIARKFLLHLNDRSYHSIFPDLPEHQEKTVGQEPLPGEILDFFRKETENESDGEICMYASPQLLDFYDWVGREFTSILNESKGVWSIRLLLSRTVEDQYDPVRKVVLLKSFFQLNEMTEMKMNVYRDINTTERLTSDPYPYWLIGERSALLISNNLENYVNIQEEHVIREFHEAFNRRTERSYHILKRYGNLSEIIREMSERCDQVVDEGKHMYVMSAIPCSVLYIQREQIRRYCSAELANLLIDYQNHLAPAVTFEFTTYAGYEKLKKNRNIPEWSFYFQYPESEMAAFEDDFRRRIKERRMYFLSEDSGYAPDNYSIVLFEDWEINIQSLSNPSIFIQVREKELLYAVQKWFSYRDEIARIEKALDLTKNPFEEVKVEAVKS